MADVDQLLRAVFEVCEATEDIEPKNDFERGRVFEAKHIRRGVGTWFQDTFCGRTHMGEPVIPTGVTAVAPTQQRKATDAEIQEWADRHDLGISSITDLRCIFEDAESAHLTRGVAGTP